VYAGRPVEGLAIPYDLRRAGTGGVVPAADRLGGTAADLGRALAGRWWTDVCGPWEFLADGTVRRAFYPSGGTYRATDGHTLEMTDPEGRTVIDLVHYGDLARATATLPGPPAKGARRDMTFRRRPAGSDEDDVLPGRMEENLVGRWRWAGEGVLLGQDAWEFRSDGTWQSVQTVTNYTLGGKYRVRGRVAELTQDQPKGAFDYHVTVTKGGRLGLYLMPGGGPPAVPTTPLVLGRVK